MTVSRLLLVLGCSAALFALPACKESKNDGAGENPAPPVAGKLGAPVPPAGGLAALEVHNVPAEPLAPFRPDMVTVPGTNMQIRISPRMKEAKDWTSSFPDYYPAIRTCLSALSSTTAYVGELSDRGDGTLLIKMSSRESLVQNCEISLAGAEPHALASEESEPNFSGPLFYPRDAMSSIYLDRAECYEREPVAARPDGLLGMLLYKKPECTDKSD